MVYTIYEGKVNTFNIVFWCWKMLKKNLRDIVDHIGSRLPTIKSLRYLVSVYTLPVPESARHTPDEVRCDGRPGQLSVVGVGVGV